MTQTLAETRTGEPGRYDTANVPDLPVRKPPTRFAGVTVIVPCYNEEGIIADTMRQLSTVLESTNRPFEVIVVDDGSSDGSSRELEACGDVRGLRVLHNSTNRGYGFSLKRAVRDAKYEIIAITDADGTYPNARLSELIDLIEDADMVVGARIGLNVNTPWLRRPPKWVLRKLASYLSETNIPDLNSGLRVMKRSLVRKFIHLLPDGFSFTTTITLALLTHGYDVRYVPIDYFKRVGLSSIRPVRDTITFLHRHFLRPSRGEGRWQRSRSLSASGLAWKKPSRVAAASDGRVAVLDSGAKLAVVFEPDGTIAQRISSRDARARWLPRRAQRKAQWVAR